MRRFLAILLVAALCFCVGCDSDSAGRIAQLNQWMGKGQILSSQLEADISVLQATLAEGRIYAASADPGDQLEVQQILSRLEGKIADFKSEKSGIDNSIAEWQTLIAKAKADPGIGSELTIYGEGIQKVGPMFPPPFDIYAVGGGTIIALLGAMLQRLRKENSKMKGGLVDVVKSVDVMLAKSANAESDRKVLGETQSDTTRELVRRIQQPSL